MPKTSHIILGLSVKTSNMVELLKKQGKTEIYVMDYEQSSKVKEINGIVYLSPEGASILTRNAKNISYYHYMYISPDSMQRRKRKGKG